jgi:hypothetical protein
MQWLMRLLPQDTRQLIQLAQRIIERLDTPEERRAAIQYGLAMFTTGRRVTIIDWSRFGSQLGVLRAKRKVNRPKNE